MSIYNIKKENVMHVDIAGLPQYGHGMVQTSVGIFIVGGKDNESECLKVVQKGKGMELKKMKKLNHSRHLHSVCLFANAYIVATGGEKSS